MCIESNNLSLNFSNYKLLFPQPHRGYLPQSFFHSYFLNRFKNFLATQGSWRGASTSTSQRLVENIATHASENQKNSYVSFQQNQVHVCGGVRMTVDQALTIEECFMKICEYHLEIYAVTLIPEVEAYRIKKFKKVNNELSILMVSSLT